MTQFVFTSPTDFAFSRLHSHSSHRCLSPYHSIFHTVAFQSQIRVPNLFFISKQLVYYPPNLKFMTMHKW